MRTQVKRVDPDVIELPRRKPLSISALWPLTRWRPGKPMPKPPRGVVIEFPRERINADGVA